MKMIALLLLSVSLIATGFESPAQRLELEDVLVVALGGYNSCGSSNNPYNIGMYDQTASLVKKLSARTPNVKYIVACLRTVAPPDGEGRYVTSEAPKDIRVGNAAKIKSVIESMSTKNTPIFVIGHSYGGWLSMYLSTQLSDRKLAGLFTVDPISPKTCGPVEVLLGSAGCHQSPRDLENADILKTTAHWLNFYQTDDRWLTSSEIDEAQNFHITYDDSHTAIDADDRVWTRIVNTVQTEVGLFRND
ncbi:MAG: hypothetical protein KDD51_09690 [Bdellovibrionales bacterium]|nr:hypothetical protein [Bdellovibrionales bacterium]